MRPWAVMDAIMGVFQIAVADASMGGHGHGPGQVSGYPSHEADKQTR